MTGAQVRPRTAGSKCRRLEPAARSMKATHRHEIKSQHCEGIGEHIPEVYLQYCRNWRIELLGPTRLSATASSNLSGEACRRHRKCFGIAESHRPPKQPFAPRTIKFSTHTNTKHPHNSLHASNLPSFLNPNLAHESKLPPTGGTEIIRSR